MNDKAKRILAIFALVFMCIFAIAFPLYLIDRKMLDGAVELIFYISAALGLGTGVPLVILNNSQIKAEKRRKLYEDIEKAEEERALAEAEKLEQEKLARIELDRKINQENNKK